MKPVFSISTIPDAVFARMQGRTFVENPYVSRADLSYLQVAYYGFDHNPHQGELIVHRLIAEEIAEIFGALFLHQYPIEKIRLMDEYDGDDNEAMEDNNSSAFNYRLIAGTDRLSKHSLGLAVDINPRYNPYIRPDGQGGWRTEPKSGAPYADRDRTFPYKIAAGDLCLRLFTERGYTWGGDWTTVKDYQHFQKDLQLCGWKDFYVTTREGNRI